MATEVFRHVQPAVQNRTSADPAPEIDIEVKHPFIPWRFNNFIYERNFTGAVTTITLTKKFNGDQEGEIAVISLGVSQTTAFFDRTVELGHGESIRVTTTGAAPTAGSDLHSISIIWEEKRNSQG
jgi:hypothetical protein